MECIYRSLCELTKLLDVVSTDACSTRHGEISFLRCADEEHPLGKFLVVQFFSHCILLWERNALIDWLSMVRWHAIVHWVSAVGWHAKHTWVAWTFWHAFIDWLSMVQWHASVRWLT